MHPLEVVHGYCVANDCRLLVSAQGTVLRAVIVRAEDDHERSEPVERIIETWRRRGVVMGEALVRPVGDYVEQLGRRLVGDLRYRGHLAGSA